VFRVEKYKITVGSKVVLLACLNMKMEKMLFFEKFFTIYPSKRGKTRILEPSKKSVFEGNLYWVSGQEDTIQRP
jgi:hypothetical protein